MIRGGTQNIRQQIVANLIQKLDISLMGLIIGCLQRDGVVEHDLRPSAFCCVPTAVEF